MKSIDIFCTSQASTSICLTHHPTMSHPTHPSSSDPAHSPELGGRAIDRHNPIIRDSRRLSFRATITPTLSAPCSSSQPPPINPTPYHQLQKSNSTTAAVDPNKSTSKASKKKKNSQKQSSSVQSDPRKSSATATLGDFITPPGSTRYLLAEPGSIDRFTDYIDPVLGLVPVHKLEIKEDADKSSVFTVASKRSSSARFNKSSSDQVVVLRVSLHCRGCERKLRKYLSRMEGVTSFNIDFAAKKVTVVGDVTPLSVLASVSKVKNAQFWTSAPSIISTRTSDQSTK